MPHSNKKEQEGYYCDSPDNIQKCLNCPFPFCTNCLDKESPGELEEYHYEWEDYVDKFGVSSIFGKVAVYHLWKMGFGDKMIAKKLHTTKQHIFEIRKKLGFKSMAIQAGHNRLEKSEFVRNYLDSKLVLKKEWDTLLDALSSGGGLDSFSKVYPDASAYEDIDIGFGYDFPWNTCPSTRREAIKCQAAVYRLWRHGYSDLEIMDKLDISRARATSYRMLVGLGTLRGQSSREMRKKYADEYMAKAKYIADEWEPLLKMFEEEEREIQSKRISGNRNEFPEAKETMRAVS